MNAVIAAVAESSLGGPVRTRSKVKQAIEAAAQGDFGLGAAEIREIAQPSLRQHSGLQDASDQGAVSWRFPVGSSYTSPNGGSDVTS
jgi:hypothetical protein